MAKTFNQFKKKIDELYWPKAGDEAKFMAMHGNYDPIKIGSPGTHDDAVFKGTIVGKDESHARTDSESRPDAQSELNDLIKNIHSKDTDELLKTVSHLNLSTDPKHREYRDVINKELMYRYKNHAMSEELIGGQKNLDVHPAGKPDGRLTAKDFAILRARKNKKKMNEESDAVVHGYVPKSKQQEFRAHMTAGGHSDEIQSDAPAGAYRVSSNPKHGADAGYQKGRAAVQLNTPEAKAHAKKFSDFTSATNEETELDEGKFANALQRGLAIYRDKSKSPLISAGIHALQTGSAARAANKYRKDTGNIEKFDDYAIKRRKVREENEVDEGWVSVNGQRVGGRRATSPLDRPDVKKALNKPRVDNPAIKDIEDKIKAKFTPDYMKQTADNAAAERKRQVDSEKKKRGIAEADVRNAYAVGTAAAMKSTGDTPPLSNSTINKSHKIAKAIMNKEEVNFNTEEIELDDGNVIEIDIELAEAIADLFDSLDEEDQDALAEMLHSDIDSFMEVVDLLENDGE